LAPTSISVQVAIERLSGFVTLIAGPCVGDRGKVRKIAR
jgi:hypothetical protein